MDNEKSQKSLQIFSCELCDYNTSSHKDYNKHLSTDKHKRITMDNEKSQKSPDDNQSRFLCLCGRSYQYSSGLSKHRRTCHKNNQISEKIDAGLVKELIQQNRELQTQLMTLTTTKSDSIVINNQVNNQVNNPHFNINMFLNEHCKNAVNFTDFINSIEVTRDDLENNAQLGFVNGITKILMNNLNQLTLQERPIHCTDVKRETMYIREANQWLKEKHTVKSKINDAIQEVSRKSLKSLIDWKKTNPEYENMDSEFSNRCIVMHQQSVAGDKTDVFYPKVMHNLAKEIAINKQLLHVTV